MALELSARETMADLIPVIQLHYLLLGIPLNQKGILHLIDFSISLKACSAALLINILRVSELLKLKQ